MSFAYFKLNESKMKIEKLQNDLKQVKDRARRLEDYGNALVAHVYCYRTQRQWTDESYQDLIQTIADWDKAKETK